MDPHRWLVGLLEDADAQESTVGAQVAKSE